MLKLADDVMGSDLMKVIDFGRLFGVASDNFIRMDIDEILAWVERKSVYWGRTHRRYVGQWGASTIGHRGHCGIGGGWGSFVGCAQMTS